MTVRFNILTGCESGTVKGIDTVNNGVYVIHKPNETYVDSVNHLEWSSVDQQTDFMEVRWIDHYQIGWLNFENLSRPILLPHTIIYSVLNLTMIPLKN